MNATSNIRSDPGPISMVVRQRNPTAELIGGDTKEACDGFDVVDLAWDRVAVRFRVQIVRASSVNAAATVNDFA